jgi:hypothetical protein
MTTMMKSKIAKAREMTTGRSIITGGNEVPSMADGMPTFGIF